jgi:hypothetical protein
VEIQKLDLPVFSIGESREGPIPLWQAVRVERQAGFTSVTFHQWFLTLLLALPLIARGLRRLRPSFPSGHCQSCGYDCRATPDRCPECGRGSEGGRP